MRALRAAAARAAASAAALIARAGGATVPASGRCAAVVRTLATAAARTWRRAAGRHADRFAGDEQYRALLLTAVGALLSTLMPPALAAAATAVVGYSGLFDRPQAPPRARDEPPMSTRYRSDDRSAGGRLWDRYDDD